MKKTLIVFILSFMVFGFIAFAHANSFTNGSFEDYTGSSLTDGFITLYDSNKDIVGWEVGGGTDVGATHGIDYISPKTWKAYDGDYSIDLNAGARGSIFQEFDTKIGTTYVVKFFMAGNPAGDRDLYSYIKTLRASAGDFAGDFTFDTTVKKWPDDANNLGWDERSFYFTATEEETTLTFTSLTLGPDGSNPYGPALDNVSVEPVPEPATMLLVGSGLIGLAGLGRRRFKNKNL